MSFKEFFQYVSIYREYIGRRLYIVFALSITVAITEGFGIALLLPLLQTTDYSGSSGAPSTAERLLDQLLSFLGIADSTMWILIFIGVVFILKGILKFMETGYRGILQANLLKELMNRLYDLYSHIDYRYTFKKNTGHFVNVITQQVNMFFLSFETFTRFLTDTVLTISYVVIAFALTWQFASMALIVGIGIMLLFRLLNKYVRNLSREISSEQSELNKLLIQGLHGLKYLISTGETSKLKQGVSNSIRRLTSRIKLQRIARAFTHSLQEPIAILFIVAIIAIQLEFLNQPLAPILVAIILFNRGMHSLMRIQSSLQLTMDRIGAVEMVNKEFNAIKRHQETSGNKVLSELQNSIIFDQVSFRYEDGESTVLKNINLEIKARNSVAFVGESGAGKSTLIDMITLLLKPTEGSIYIDGIDSRELDLASWRAQIGYVSQETVIFDDTVANNICLWSGEYKDEKELQKRIQESAHRAYAHDFIMSLPDGYQTKVGERGFKLSGGQRQRLFIARELFKNPNLLILDEATSALDTESERYIQKSIDALKGEITVVIIAHRLSTIKSVDMVFVLDNGYLVESGTYDNLSSMKESKFKEMVEMQSL